MAKQHSTAAKITVAALAIGIFVAAPTASLHAIPLSRAAWPIYTVVVERTAPPPGWAEFCRTYKSECDVQPSIPRKIAVTPEVWDKMVQVNYWENARIRPTTDRKHWGRPNKWYFAEDGRGDCKDYVLAKRRMLMESGLPREALLITIVWTPDNFGHAVLIVRTDKGDYVLDNLSSKIVRWNQTPYDYAYRQTQSNPNAWVFIDGDPLKPPKIAEDLAENPLDEPTVMVSDLNGGVPKIEVIAGSAMNGEKSKPQMIASRGIDDSTASRKSIVPSPKDENNFKAQMVAARGDESAQKKDVIPSHPSDVVTPGREASINLRDTPTWKEQGNAHLNSPRLNEEATIIDAINSETLKQLLANGVDGETLVQLIIAGSFKDGGASMLAVASSRTQAGSKQRVTAVSTPTLIH
jgi:predicted transglutaminase-like cysteine proteinase